MSTRVCIIAGEISGDHHAAALVEALKVRIPDVQCFGTGGEHMRAAGVETLYDVSDLAVMGISEVLRRYSFFRGMFKRMCRELDSRKPDVVVLVDYPGFNLRFAAQARKRGIKTVFYICPQVWAWKPSRIPKMARILDHLITIFPFEAKYFEHTGLPTTFAGHPLVDALQGQRNGASMDSPRMVALLPGSRVHEIRRILPTQLQACTQLLETRNDVSFVIAAADAALSTLIEAQLDAMPAAWQSTVRPRVSIRTGEARTILCEAHAAWVASGTATLETALLHCPMIITYRVAALTYALAKRIVRLDHIGMVNIIAGRTLCPEYVQDAATPHNLVSAILPLLEDSPERREMLSGFDSVAHSLGEGGAALRAADVVAQVISRG